MANNDLRYEGKVPENYEQKCPLVLVLDVSGSMFGNPIDDLNRGLEKFRDEIKKDITAASRLQLAIVTFGSDIEVVQDFALINDFDMPTLSVNGTTKLVDGMKKGLNILEERKRYYKQSGQTYYRPYIVLMTDGYPDSDQDTEWLKKEINSQYQGKHLNFWAFGVEGTDMSLLNKLSHDGSLVQKLKGTEFVTFFKWLSSSMTAVTHSKEDDKLDIAPKSEEENPFQIKV